MMNFSYPFIEGQARFDMPRGVNMNLALNKKFVFHTSTPTPSMHRKLTEHGKLFCMQKNQQPNKTLVELRITLL